MKNRKDYFFKKAKKEGYRARSVYKLIILNKKYNLIKRNDKLLDLGCSPGSWLQASLNLVGKNGLILGIDLENIKEIKEVNFMRADIGEKETIEKIKLVSESFDVIISDLSPKTTGIKELDVERSIDLNERVLEIADEILKENGNLLLKVFQGPNFQDFLKKIKLKFRFVKCQKPEASRKESKEIYIIAKEFKKD
jgi:23S rRNA (uridine2552-2'-O)-methyltransferase